jgi:hypothetical protein
MNARQPGDADGRPGCHAASAGMKEDVFSESKRAQAAKTGDG